MHIEKKYYWLIIPSKRMQVLYIVSCHTSAH